MYDETASYWSATRNKTLGKGDNKNWLVVQRYLDKLAPGMAVLDVGCGNGRLISGINSDIKYVGFDFAKNLLAEAKNMYPERDLRYGNMVERETWRGLGKFEAVFCVAALHHLPDRDQQLFALKMIKKVLKKDGFVFLSVWNLWQERFAQDHLDSFELKKENPRFVKIPFNKKWKRFCVHMDIPYLVELVEEAGLTLTEIFYADREGNQATIQSGQNLVLTAKNN